MNPLHLLTLVSLAVRLARWGFGRGSNGDAKPTGTVPTDHLATGWVTVVGVVGLLGLGCTGPLGIVLVGPTVVALWEPSWLARWLVPRGHEGLAWWVTRLSLHVWRRDRRGGAALVSAQAALAGGRVPAAPTFEGPVTTGIVLAAGITLVADGQERSGSSLVAASGWFDAQPAPLALVREEWVAADHARRGAWDQLALAADQSPSSPRLQLLRATAERLLDLDEAPDAATYERLAQPFAEHPDWKPIISRGRSARHRRPFRGPDLPEDAFARALEIHRRALLDPSWIEAALEAWTDAPPPDAVRERVVVDLALVCTTSRITPDPVGPIGAAVLDRLESTLLDDLTAQATALTHRRSAHLDLPPLAEAAEFAWFVDRFPVCAETPDGAALLRRRLAFRAVYAPLVDWSAELYNVRNEPYLFRAVTRWLLAQARLARDDQAEATLTHNLAVSRLWS